MEITIEKITELQKTYGFDTLQRFIDTGDAWKTEGHIGRQAMAALESGACMLPEEQQIDAYGNIVPSRDNVKAGSKGTLENSQVFWEKVENGEINLNEEI